MLWLIGGFLALWGLLAALLWAWAWGRPLLARRRARRAMARRLVDSLRSLYAGRHEYRVAEPARFSHLDLAWYEETSGFFESAGFRRLGDLENITINESPHAAGRTMLRYLSGAGGSILACLVHIVPENPPGAHGAKLVELTTRLADGGFLITSTAAQAGAMSFPPALRIDWQIGALPPALLAAHRNRLEKLLADHPETPVQPVDTLSQVIEGAHRIEDLKTEHRRGLGFVLSEEEIRKTLGHALPEAEIRKLKKEIDRFRVQS
ncbi:MAG TPA: hypothetical protein DD490_13840 [Acidobacteria bacterium]|nr:hypothetical protein [Acidobacteriota bacterium]